MWVFVYICTTSHVDFVLWKGIQCKSIWNTRQFHKVCRKTANFVHDLHFNWNMSIKLIILIHTTEWEMTPIASRWNSPKIVFIDKQVFWLLSQSVVNGHVLLEIHLNYVGNDDKCDESSANFIGLSVFYRVFAYYWIIFTFSDDFGIDFDVNRTSYCF